MISICIPTYEMQGRGVEMLGELIESIESQHAPKGHFVEVVVSDNSQGDEIKDFCSRWPDYWRYFRNDKSTMATNLNNAIDHAKGEIIKPMCQDDKFIEPDSLQKIADTFRYGTKWVACTSNNQGWGDDWYASNWIHVPYPHKSLERLRLGENTYGSPSAMAWVRNDLRFDENLEWLIDCEFYARMAERFGTPKFVDTAIYIRQWSGQVTHTLGHQRVLDSNYVAEKYR